MTIYYFEQLVTFFNINRVTKTRLVHEFSKNNLKSCKLLSGWTFKNGQNPQVKKSYLCVYKVVNHNLKKNERLDK